MEIIGYIEVRSFRIHSDGTIEVLTLLLVAVLD